MAVRKLKEKDSIETETASVVDIANFTFKTKLTEEFEKIINIAIEENINKSEASLYLAFNFIFNLNNLKKAIFPSLFLLDNGNIRAIWRIGRNQIGLQFLDRKIIQYVLMKEQGEELNTAYGRVQQENISKIITSMDLESLIYAKG